MQTPDTGYRHVASAVRPGRQGVCVIDADIPGLVLNELLTNAIKYGWASGAGRNIGVTRACDGDRGALIVKNAIRDANARPMTVASSGPGGAMLDGFVAQCGGHLSREVAGTHDRVTPSFPMDRR